MRVSRAETTLNYVLLLGFAAFALAPVLTILATSVSAPLGQSGGLHLENFAKAWTVGGFGSSLGHSAVVAVIVVGLASTLSILAGYAFGTMRFRGSTVLFYLFLLGMMIPAEATIIPLFFDLRTLGLTDTYLAIAMPQVAQSIAFGTFWLRSQFRALPVSLVEAAALDGAHGWKLFRHLTLPLLSPIVFFLSITGIISAAQTFDIISIMTGGGPGTSSSTLSWMVYEEAFQKFDIGTASAAATVLLLLLLLITYAQVRYGEKTMDNAS